jgi:hypothetical protein
MLSPVLPSPVLLVENKIRTLVFADLHLGIEAELRSKGIHLPSRTSLILKKVLECVKKTDPEKIVLVGDVKHSYPKTSWQEYREIPSFLEKLAAHAEVLIVPGNHDALLRKLTPKGVILNPSRGFTLDEVSYFHGHTWPDPRLFSSKWMVVAHNHLSVSLEDELGGSSLERIWIKTKVKRRKVKVIVMPAFNELLGSVAVNKVPPSRLLGPMFRRGKIDIDGGEVYLLDGTFLGRVKELR